MTLQETLAALAAALMQLSALLQSHEIVAYAAELPPPTPVVKEIALAPELHPVCSCESTGSAYNEPVQFNKDGSVRRGKINPHDIGMCQINTDWNGADAKALGFDIYTREGNIKMANYLYEHRGLQPWSASRACWKPVENNRLTLNE